MGHLEALYLIVHYLKKYPCRRIIFDPRTVLVDENAFYDTSSWVEFYGNVVEGEGGSTRYAGAVGQPGNDHMLRRCRPCYKPSDILNRAPPISFSKRQNTCESSTYGSELVAMQIARI